MPGFRNVVDKVPAAGVLRCEGTDVAERGVQVILVASVVDDPEVGDAVGLNAATTITIDDIIDNQRGRRVRAQVQDDPVSIGVVAGPVVFPGNDVVRSYVVKAGIRIEPRRRVVGDGAGPTVEISIVVDEIVIGGQVVTVDCAHARPARVIDTVSDKAHVMTALTEEAVQGIVLTVKVEAAKLQIGRPRRKLAISEFEHRLRNGAARPHKVYRAVAVVLVDNPGRGRSAHRRIERGTQVVGSSQQAHD